MKHLRLSIVALVVLGALASVTGALAAAAGTGAVTKIGAAQTGLGRVLVDSRGHTLYLFEKDARGKSNCAGACTHYWPPLITTAKPLAIAGARTSLLATTRRADGRLQVTYNHHPLYTFFGDTRKGQTSGEGLNDFGAQWYALSPAGVKVDNDSAKAAPSTSGSNGTPGYGGYGG